MPERPVVLVAEDESPLYDIIEEALTAAGFEPAFVGSAEEAAALLKGHPADYKALVVDVGLEGKMLGWELATLARQLSPELPVVYTTAGHGHGWTAKGVPNSVLVQKPFAPAQLVTAISQLLNKGSSA